MSIILLQWALFSFLLGLVLAVLLVPNNILRVPAFTRVFVHGHRLRSAHLDFLMQGFALCLAYLLEGASGTPLPLFIVVPLVFGSLMNPVLFLIESTPMYQHPAGIKLHQVLTAFSPTSVLFAWFCMGARFLPAALQGFGVAVVSLGAVIGVAYSIHKGKAPQSATAPLASE